MLCFAVALLWLRYGFAMASRWLHVGFAVASFCRSVVALLRPADLLVFLCVCVSVFYEDVAMMMILVLDSVAVLVRTYFFSSSG